MEILRVELPLQKEPQFFCPYSGYNLVTEGLNDAVEEGYICLSVNCSLAISAILILGVIRRIVRLCSFPGGRGGLRVPGILRGASMNTET